MSKLDDCARAVLDVLFTGDPADGPEFSRQIARAMRDELREPSEAMRKAQERAEPLACDCTNTWPAMIDAVED